jgi:polysaccharide pyruvyl transferase WcaK-like protein
MGEVAQVAGLLKLLQREVPSARLTVWATSLAHGAEPWLRKRFPKVKFITGTIGRDGKPDQPELQQAWEECDFFLHGPSTHVIAREHIEAWKRHARKPFGIYGVTLDDIDAKLKGLLEAAQFVFLRDGASRALAIRQGIKASQVSFVPDAALASDLLDDKSAEAWLAEHNLKAGEFVCVVPKLRFTPYWEIFDRSPKYAEIAQEQMNRRCREEDLSLIREAVIQYLKAHPNARLLCAAEMPYQVALGQELVSEKFPESLRSRCVVREDAWLPDEAASIFAQAQWVLTMELLSAVVAQTVGTPAIHLRPPTDATQGQMWRDLGLRDWFFELDQVNAIQLAEALLKLKETPEVKARTLFQANEFIRESETAGMNRLASALGAPSG